MGRTWRFIFLINIPICVIAILCSFRQLEESTMNTRKTFDIWGVLVLSAGLFLITYALTASEEKGMDLQNGIMMTVSGEY